MSRTALFVAARHNFPENIRLLLQFGSNPHRLDSQGRSPLTVAAIRGGADVITALLQGGASPLDGHHKGLPDAYWAARSGSLAASKAMLERRDVVEWEAHGAFYGAVDGCTSEVLSYLLTEWNEKFGVMKTRGAGLASFAAAQGCVAGLDLLMDDACSPVAPDTRNTQGLTLLQLAVVQGQEHVLKQLIRRGADVNAAGPGKTTALLLAAEQADGRASIIDTLLAAGADPNARSDEGWTALILAIEAGNVLAPSTWPTVTVAPDIGFRCAH